MGISVGGINLAEAAIDAQLRVGVLEKIVEHLLNRLGQGAISQQDIECYREQTIKDLQTKYPQAGIRMK